jgi:methionyl-tRNA formyltransferase
LSAKVPLKIAFFGLPLAGCLLAADGHQIVLAAISRQDAPGRRRLARLIDPSRVHLRPKLDAGFIKQVRAAAPDLVVSWFWTSLLPPALVDAAPLGGIGAHPSLLPRHRGPDPTYHAILAGDRVSGVTVHRIAADYDTGAILARAELDIDDRWNAYDLACALDRPSLRLLREVTRAFARGAPPPDVLQDETAATLAPFPEEDDLWIAWDRSTADVIRQVRALAPAPGAVTEIGESVVTVLEVAPLPAAPSVLEVAGESAFLQGRCVIRTRDGAVALSKVDIDGEPATPDDLRALLHGS